jgi:hypothetical protein
MRRRNQTQLEKELADNSRLLSAWRQWHREQLDEVLKGPHAHLLRELLQFLRSMTLKSAPQLIRLIRGQDWRRIDAATKLTVLHEINGAITRLRERNGLPPFDDSLETEPRTGFLIVRELLRCR